MKSAKVRIGQIRRLIAGDWVLIYDGLFMEQTFPKISNIARKKKR